MPSSSPGPLHADGPLPRLPQPAVGGLPHRRTGRRTDPEGFGNGDITTRQAHVWPEVYFEGVGWVAFEPTPARVPASEPPPRSRRRKSQQAPAGSSRRTRRRRWSSPRASRATGSSGPNGRDLHARCYWSHWPSTRSLGSSLRRRCSAGAACGVRSPPLSECWAPGRTTDRLLEVGVPSSRIDERAREVARSAESHIPSRRRAACPARSHGDLCGVRSQPTGDGSGRDLRVRDPGVISEVLMSRSPGSGSGPRSAPGRWSTC